MAMWTKSVGVGLAVLLAAGLVGCGEDTARGPRWCPEVAGHRVECGVMSRPLVDGKPELGSVEVGYAMVRHAGTGAAAGTVLPNPGGPGVPLISRAAEAVQVAGALLGDHDLLLIDPRGTGVSSPLNCGVGNDEFQYGTREQQIEAVGRCGAQLGPRAAGYTSAATVDDFDAVRERLGIRKLVLYGISYGTYLLPVYAQRHPEHVRSIVLSGAYPPDFDRLQRPNAEAVSLALHRICERSRACDGDTAVADLRTVAARLRAEPIRVTGPHPILLTEGEFGNLVFETGSTNVGADPQAMTPLGMLPAALHEAARGNDGPLREFAERAASEPAYENIDLYITVACNDYPTLWAPQASLAEREQQYRRAVSGVELGAFSGEGFGAAQRDGGEVCVRWRSASHPRPDQITAPLPDVPVLVLSGDLDAITPDANGERAAARFRHARFVSVPNTGHVPDLEPSGCVVGMIERFVRTGTPGPTECVAALPPIAVTPVTN
ncbi:alpha/beta fold hydrolase [Nocardia terpenica]|uniref:alpha/beta fold hydrolase n=1 Tax=Nocardia terpenica TaxID=455432 RepID=UPI0018940975|nr:alpha/beta fold hydrolase [Nocardia terpenica]MBF6059895.1 alpha/beta fold hydrolase [Nocardia terpenica]MBF6102564.1 alpha/beta fold hydrolase [Nocardia terpenica]MBF6111245.1 alpha/beta fold hydrolase [Nocardia terpenica]MBF6117376.1 alpha/beta fold hydrolase [Nocardia terpenica]MBF6150783.1 alpha/beta fold hydrolase [Nocardia terpenica]